MCARIQTRTHLPQVPTRVHTDRHARTTPQVPTRVHTDTHAHTPQASRRVHAYRHALTHISNPKTPLRDQYPVSLEEVFCLTLSPTPPPPPPKRHELLSKSYVSHAPLLLSIARTSGISTMGRLISHSTVFASSELSLRTTETNSCQSRKNRSSLLRIRHLAELAYLSFLFGTKTTEGTWICYHLTVLPNWQ